MNNKTSWALTGLLGLALSLGSVADAAGQMMYGASYGLSQSLSDTKDFADDFSFRNFSGEFRQMVGTGASFGASIAWNVFHEERIEATQLEGLPVTASGLQFRTINTVPVLLTAHRYFGARRQPRAYVGVGAGLAYTKARVDMGILAVDDSSWDFAAVPEVGFFLPTGGSSEIYVNAKYQWTSGDLGAQAIHFNIGIMSWPISF